MLLSELTNLVKLESGLYNIDLSELIDDNYKAIVEKRVLPIVGKYRPYSVEKQVPFTASSYTFTSDIPDWISEVKPLNLMISNPVFELVESRQLFNEIKKPTFLWKYDKPTLYLEYSGNVVIKACYNTPTLVAVENSSPTDYTITNLDSQAEEYVIKLTSGYVMVAAGRSGRAVKIPDLGVELDVDSLVSEGNELIQNTMEMLQKSTKWFLGI